MCVTVFFWREKASSATKLRQKGNSTFGKMARISPVRKLSWMCVVVTVFECAQEIIPDSHCMPTSRLPKIITCLYAFDAYSYVWVLHVNAIANCDISEWRIRLDVRLLCHNIVDFEWILWRDYSTICNLFVLFRCERYGSYSIYLDMKMLLVHSMRSFSFSVSGSSLIDARTHLKMNNVWILRNFPQLFLPFASIRRNFSHNFFRSLSPFSNLLIYIPFH